MKKTKKQKKYKKDVKSNKGPRPIGKLFTEKDEEWFIESDKKGLL